MNKLKVHLEGEILSGLAIHLNSSGEAVLKEGSKEKTYLNLLKKFSAMLGLEDNPLQGKGKISS